MSDEYEIDCSGTEDEVIGRVARRAYERHGNAGGWKGEHGWIEAIGPLVRGILALLAAIGAKSVREALSKAKAMAAPVDVEKEVNRLADEIREGREAIPDRPMTDVLRPLVADRARLAREVARLTQEWADDAARAKRLYLDGTATLQSAMSERDEARADLESCGGELQTCRVTLAEERADVDKLGLELAAARDEAADWASRFQHAKDQAEAARAEIARLTAELAERTAERDRLNRWWGDVRKMFGEDTKKISRYAAALEATDASMSCDEEREAGQYLRMLCYAFAAVDEPDQSRTAAPGEAWERLREAARGACVEVKRQRCEAMPFDRLEAALAAVEPRVDAITADPSAPVDPAEQAYQPTVEIEPRRIDDGSLGGYLESDDGPDGTPTPAEQREIIASAPRWPLCVDCSTDGDTQHIPTVARPTGRCARCGNGGIMYAPRDEVTDAELADAIERTSGDGPLAWPGSILRRLALAEQARREAPAMSAERAREVAEPIDAEDLWTDYCTERPHLTASDRLAFLEGVAAARRAATPPRALTEAEARQWASRAELIGEDGERSGIATINDVVRLLVRGDVPPEVRPAVDPSFVQATGTHTFGGRLRSDVRPMHAPEMAVTTGEVERAPDTCEHGTLFSWPCDDCEREMAVVTCEEPKIAPREVRYQAVMKHDARIKAGLGRDETDPPTGVPGIAGPAGLALASGPSAGYWDKGVAVERQSGDPPARPRVGAWVAWEPACGASVYDDHGQVVASVWEAPDGWRWSANRPHLAPAQGGPVPPAEAKRAALDVLATWCDVSVAGAES